MKKVTVNGKEWTVNDIRNLLLTSDAACIRAMLRINERQTQDEQAAQQTRYLNHKGFRSCHGKFSGYVKYYERFNTLTERQMQVLRRSMPMYAGQLFRIMQEENQPATVTSETVTV